MSEHTAEKIVLDYPVRAHDKTISELTMRRPTLNDVLQHHNAEDALAGEAALVVALCSLRLEDLRLLDLADYEKLQDRLLFFRSATSRRGNEALPDSGAFNRVGSA